MLCVVCVCDGPCTCRYGLHGTSESGWLHLDFKSRRGGSIALCELACLWGKCPAEVAHLKDDVDFHIDGEPVHTASKGSARFDLLLHSKLCVEIGSLSPAFPAPGPHTLSLRVNTEGRYLLLSHLLWF